MRAKRAIIVSQKRDTSRGSPGSFSAKKPARQDDNQLDQRLNFL